MFVCLLKRQIFDFKTKLDKDKNTTYIHWTQKIKKRFRKSVALIPIKLSYLDLKVDTWQPSRVLEWVPVFKNTTKNPQDI